VTIWITPERFSKVVLKKFCKSHIPACFYVRIDYLIGPIRAGSSAVEQLAFNQLAEGSIPSPRTTSMVVNFAQVAQW
jgi:hypothetical protein